MSGIQSDGFGTILKTGEGAGAPQVMSSDHTVLTTDGDFFCDLSGGAWTVKLPSNPSIGEKHNFKDHLFYATTNNLTIDGNGKNVEQWAGGTAPTLVLNRNGDSVALQYNGTTWSIV